MERLCEQIGMGARALEFAILTAVRSGKVRGATCGEIDLTAALWVVPAARMKAGKKHQVPLSPAALAAAAQGLPRMRDTYMWACGDLADDIKNLVSNLARQR